MPTDDESGQGASGPGDGESPSRGDTLADDVEAVSTIEDLRREEDPSEPVHGLNAEVVGLLPADRYEPGRLLGEGGMGTVTLTADRQIGRHVAMKVLREHRKSSPDAARRFVREARIQGQLEHPALVPVYDLGVDERGGVFFTMKRVRGVTLEALIDDLARRKESEVSHSQRRLLTAFSRVCLAVDYAHRRGVLHRDLKPANVMLGDFGEVYVLDWGLAGLLNSGAEALAAGEAPRVVEDDASPEGGCLGTPGYASPEQLRGELTDLGPATDVYGLGAILFEIVCHCYLHPRRTIPEIVASTLSGALARPSIRAPEREVAPEIEEILVRATALDPAERYGTAREMHEAVERFLDGERDVERRRSLADEHARIAASHVHDLGTDEESRKLAMAEIGRSLSLDPENEKALGVLQQVLTEPPTTLPTEVVDEMERRYIDRFRWMARMGVVTYSCMILYLPLLVASGVRDALPIVIFVVLSLFATVASFVVWKSARPKAWLIDSVMLASNVAMACIGTFFGALLVTPAAIAINTTPYALYMKGAHRWLAIVSSFVIVATLIVAGFAGVLPVSYEFAGDRLTLEAGAIEFVRGPSSALLIAVALGHLVTNIIVVGRIQSDLQEVEVESALQTWLLRQLAPNSGGVMLDSSDIERRHSGQRSSLF